MSALNNTSVTTCRPGTVYVVNGEPLEIERGHFNRIPSTKTTLAVRDRFVEDEREIESLWLETEADEHQDTVSSSTKENATEFLRQLPIDIKVRPEVDVLPNGQISLRWSSDQGDITVIVKQLEIHYGHRLANGERYAGFMKWSGRPNHDIIEKIRQVVL